MLLPLDLWGILAPHSRTILYSTYFVCSVKAMGAGWRVCAAVVLLCHRSFIKHAYIPSLLPKKKMLRTLNSCENGREVAPTLNSMFI